LPVAFLVCVQGFGMLVLIPWAGRFYGHVWSVAAVSVGAVAFATMMFAAVDVMQRRIIRQNEELSALNAVSQAVSGPVELGEAIGRALANVMEVMGARAGQILLTDDTGGEASVSLGMAGDLESFGAVCDIGHGHESESCAVRIVEMSAGDAAQMGLPSRSGTTFACAPLRAKNRVLGVMRLLDGEGNHMSAEGSERLLAAMGNQIAVAIEAGQLFEDVLRRAKETEALYEIALNITSHQDVQQTLESILEHGREMLGGECAAVCLAQGSRGTALVATSGPKDAFLRPPVRVMPLTPPTSSDGKCAPSSCDLVARKYGGCQLTAPLIVGASKIGELCLFGTQQGVPTERQRQLMAGLADMAAVAISNARLLEGEKQVAVLEERHRLSREMHDSLAQVLGYLHLRAQVTRHALARGETAKALRELEDMTSLAHEAYADVRGAILDLRESVSPEAGLAGTLREYLQKFTRLSGIGADLEVREEELPKLSPWVEVQLLRVVQEALTNVRKHANADKVWIHVESKGPGLTISVEDNGQGFDPTEVSADGSQFGVEVMRERVERVGGQFQIESVPGRGTTIRFSVSPEEGGRHDAG